MDTGSFIKWKVTLSLQAIQTKSVTDMVVRVELRVFCNWFMTHIK